MLKAENSYFPVLLSLVSAIAAFRIGDQRAISAFTKLLNCAGVRSSLLGIDPPRSASFVFTPGSSRDRSSAAASLSMTPLGVPLGAKNPSLNAHLIVHSQFLRGRHIGKRRQPFA